MTIDELARIATSEFLNQMASGWIAEPNLVIHASRAAEFPFLEKGANNNGLFFELTVSSNPDSGIPQNLVLKAANNVAGTAEREMLFYKLLAEQGQIAEIPRCFGTHWLEESDMGLLLLEKISVNAIEYNGPVEVHVPHYRTAARTLAALHARWWNHPRLGDGDFTLHWTDDLLTSATAWANAGLASLVESHPGSLSDLDIATIADVIVVVSELLAERAESRRNLCVNHGDAALWNFVMDEDDASVSKLVDFQLWCVNPPAWDVGYMIYLLWPTEFRRRHGEGIIRAYLDELSLRGVRYGEADLYEDLRICILGLVTLNLANYNLGIWPYERVKERLSWIMAAFHELGCDKFTRR